MVWLLNRIIIKILGLPIISRPIVYMWHLYHIAQLNKVQNHTLKNLFTTSKKLDISSDFPRHDIKALESVVQMVLKENIVVAEVGSWKGMSTSIIAKIVKPFNGKVFAIDHWQGSDSVPEHKQAETNDMLSTFRYNMKSLGILDIIYPMVMDSKIASSIFKDKSLDLIFIDADHRYSEVYTDIMMWLPKLKKGGIICGHDCEEKYTKLGEYIKTVNEHLDEDVLVGICHPGVVRALYDIFQDDYSIVPDSSIWWKRI